MQAFSGFNDEWDLQYSDEEIEATQTSEAAPQPLKQPVSQPKTQPQTQPAQQPFDFQNPVVKPNTTNNNQNFEPFGQESWADPMPANNDAFVPANTDAFVTDSWDANANIDPFGNTESWADQDPIQYAEVAPEPVQETTYQPQAPKSQQMTQPMVDNFDEEKEEDVPVATHTEQRKQKETRANTQRNKKPATVKPATVIQSSKVATAGSGWKNMKGTSMFKQQPQQRKQAAVRKQQPPKGPRKTQSKQQPARQKSTKPTQGKPTQGKPTQSKMTQSKPEPKAQAPPRQAQPAVVTQTLRQAPPALTLESLQKQIFALQARVAELESKQGTTV